jgi:hypothetical protein
MDPVFSRLITTRSNHAAFVTSYEHRLSFQRGIVEYLDRYEEGVEVEVSDMVLYFPDTPKVVIGKSAIAKLGNCFKAEGFTYFQLS